MLDASAMQVDANVVWQEWQTISRAQTLATDLVGQSRLLRRLDETLALAWFRICPFWVTQAAWKPPACEGWILDTRLFVAGGG